MRSEIIIDAICTVTVILGGLMCGYTLRRSGHVTKDYARVLNNTVLTYIQPPIMLLALWTMQQPDARALALPVLSAALILIMWPVGAGLARLLSSDDASRGNFVLGAMFSNVGFTYGTFLAFVVMGPQGAALGALYCVSFMPVIFTVGFLIARRYGADTGASVGQTAARLVRDPVTRNPLLGILGGLLLNMSGYEPPAMSGQILDIAIPISTALLLASIGIRLRLSAVSTYWRECAMLHGARFVISPLIAMGLAWLFGYFAPGRQDLLRTVLIQSATPSAILAVVVSDLVGLNRELAGALWLSTNATSILLAPILIWIASSI